MFWRLWVRIPAPYTEWTFFAKIVMFFGKEVGDVPLKKQVTVKVVALVVKIELVSCNCKTVNPTSNFIGRFLSILSLRKFSKKRFFQHLHLHPCRKNWIFSFIFVAHWHLPHLNRRLATCDWVIKLFHVQWMPGLVVMGGDSCSEGCGFESRHRILDGHFSHIGICCKFCLFENTK